MFTATRFNVWFYSLIMMYWLLFHPQSLSVGDMNFVHWLSSFCYPDRTTATLLDQVDHPFGYTFRPANKTVSHVLKCDWSVVWTEYQVLYLKQRCLFQFSIRIFVCGKQTKNVDWTAIHCYWDFRWLLTGDMAKLRIVHKIMWWTSSSAQLTAHISSHTSDSFDN